MKKMQMMQLRFVKTIVVIVDKSKVEIKNLGFVKIIH